MLVGGVGLTPPAGHVVPVVLGRRVQIPPTQVVLEGATKTKEGLSKLRREMGFVHVPWDDARPERLVGESEARRMLRLM